MRVASKSSYDLCDLRGLFGSTSETMIAQRNLPEKTRNPLRDILPAEQKKNAKKVDGEGTNSNAAISKSSVTPREFPRKIRPIPALLKIPQKVSFKSAAAKLIYLRATSTNSSLHPQADTELPGNVDRLFYSGESE